MSGVDLNGTQTPQGRGRRGRALSRASGGQAPAELEDAVDRVARSGGTPLVVARDNRALGVIH